MTIPYTLKGTFDPHPGYYEPGYGSVHMFNPWNPQSGKVIMPAWSVRARGKIKNVAIFKWYSFGVIECRLYEPTNPRTSFQQANRSKFASAISTWQALPEETKDEWRSAAKWRRRHMAMSGYNLFIRRYMLDQPLQPYI